MNEDELLLLIQLGYFDEEEDNESDNFMEEINSGLYNLFDSLSRLGEINK